MQRKRLKTHSKVSTKNALARAGKLLVAGHGTRHDAEGYMSTFYRDYAARMHAIAKLTRKDSSWEFMRGAYKQAIEIYVIASVLYTKHPAHSILSDASFDALAKFLLKEYKHLDKSFLASYGITKDALIAGTGYTTIVTRHIEDTVYAITNGGVTLRETIHGIQDTKAVKSKPGKKRRLVISGSVGRKRRKRLKRHTPA